MFPSPNQVLLQYMAQSIGPPSCPFDVFCSMFLRRTVSPLLKVNFRPPVLLRYCCFCFCWATSMFLSILGKTASLISVIFSICACKLSSEHSSVITLLIASSPSSRGVTRVPPKHDKKWTTLGSGRNH